MYLVRFRSLWFLMTEMHNGVEWLLSCRSLAAEYLNAMPGRRDGALSGQVSRAAASISS